MATLQTALFVIALALQVWLIFLLFSRRMASQVALFPALILSIRFVQASCSGFLITSPAPPMRISTARSLAGHPLADRARRRTLLDDPALRFEITSSAHPSNTLPLPYSPAAFTGSRRGSPSHSPVPADRAIIFTGFLFLLLFGWSFSVRLAPWRRSVLIGLAAIGGSGIFPRSPQKLLRQLTTTPHLFSLWSYGNAGAYLIVLFFWVLRCQPVTTTATRPVQSVQSAKTSFERGRRRTIG